MRSIPLFFGAAIVAGLYGQLPVDEGGLESFLSWQHNTLAAVIVVILAAVAWQPKPFIQRTGYALIAAIICSVLFIPLVSFGLFLVISVFFLEFGANEVLVWPVAAGLLSAMYAIAMCLTLFMTDVIQRIDGRTLLYCGVLCMFSALPLVFDVAHSIGVYKGLWIALFGLGLCVGVPRKHVRRDSNDHTAGLVMEGGANEQR
ncbi:MAG: hypothetical protein AAAFM81_05285 [Pseudomonadota bacterium]